MVCSVFQCLRRLQPPDENTFQVPSRADPLGFKDTYKEGPKQSTWTTPLCQVKQNTLCKQHAFSHTNPSTQNIFDVQV